MMEILKDVFVVCAGAAFVVAIWALAGACLLALLGLWQEYTK